MAAIANSQSNTELFNSSLIHITNFELDKASKIISKSNANTSVELKTKKLLNNYVSYLKTGKELNILFSDSSNNSNKELRWLNSISHSIYAEKKSHEVIKEKDIIHKHYWKSLNLALQTKDNGLICFILKKIIYSVLYNPNTRKELKDYLELYKIHAKDNFERLWYQFYNLRYDKKEKIKELESHLDELEKLDATFLKANYHIHIGLHYNDFKRNSKKARYHYNKAIELLKTIRFNNLNQYLFQSHANSGVTYYHEGNYNKALEKFKVASELKISNNRFDYLANLERWKLKCFIAINDSENALNSLEKREILLDSISNYQQGLAIKETEAKFNNEKLRADNLETKARSKQNQNIAIGLAGSLALGSIIAFLLFKNTKRKQKLAEQDKEIETQKLATVLKEQELTAIDAMIEGQEKERQRIANDLHDDLGGLMATVKLHFNALKDKKSPELFDKTNTLIDEAYNKVRSVAHAKNSGVIAKHGLLKSVKEMANKISISNQLEIEVIDYGLETRLENSLELTLFRVIQELVSNAVKHAQASEISIHITNHEDMINLMVEDNGIGFNTKQMTKTNKGMGINSIDKRVEYLDGKMTIESEKNKGTTIIIDIPL
ncbi:sensor histidine kinase [uncultured Winogradskyella sp.]|uniref:tetratricopeptide repeat-containing sensor histidine kinase n=1 Tax=uncultured Winogradskyella sp. TaxID=395353 RepID=UPI002627FF20|nr:sensor histidine kinase [uncultured Winogradskyella sp.]